MLPGVPERASHDDVRHGTSSLFAALDVATGKVVGSTRATHRAVEFKKILIKNEDQIPAELDVSSGPIQAPAASPLAPSGQTPSHSASMSASSRRAPAGP